jgi:hypothetical protein
MNGDERKTARPAEEVPQSNSNFSIGVDVYKNCFTDYVKGIGSFGSPFAFLSYGITYEQMLYFTKYSVEFLIFIFNLLISDIPHATQDKIVKFLAEAGLTAAEIKEIIKTL